MSLGRRLTENPLLSPRDVRSSLPELEVVSVFNAAAARVGDEVVLLLRVAERPRSDIDPPPGSLTLDLDGSHPLLRPLPRGLLKEDVIGMCVLDVTSEPPQVTVAYIPKSVRGLDLSDPRAIRYRRAGHGRQGEAEGYVDYLTQISHLRVARSPDGIHFAVDPSPAIAPRVDMEEYGVEDPRATFIDGLWHVTYVSVSRWGITTSLATTADFRSFTRRGVIFLPDHKDVAIFPERVGGRYAALTRPMPQSFSRILGIWIAYSDDLLTWGGHETLCLPRWERWDEQRTGASAVPFRTGEGWLEIYHGVDHNDRYALGALLLDGNDPRRVIGRSPVPLFEPEADYERTGFFNDTVFSCGHVDLGDGRIRVYYGAADSLVAAADFEVRDILASLEPARGAAARLPA